MDGISKLLSTDGFIQVNKTLIKKLGLHEAIMIGELCAEYNYWQKQNKLEEEMFYSTRENIEENTGLSEHFQRKAISTLKEYSIVEIKKKGIPAVNYYKINFDKLLILLSSSCQSRRQLDIESVDLNNNKQTNITNKDKVLSKDNTTEFSLGYNKQQIKKPNMYTKYVNLIDQKTDNPQIRSLLISWLNMLIEKYRDKGKVVYANVFSGKLRMLDKYDKKDWADIIEYNLQRGYEGFYPIPQYTSGTSYDVRKGKPWEEGVRSDRYTEEELKEIEELNKQREAQGLRTHF